MKKTNFDVIILILACTRLHSSSVRAFDELKMIYTNNNNNDSNIGAIIGSVRSFVSNLFERMKKKGR